MVSGGSEKLIPMVGCRNVQCDGKKPGRVSC